MDEGKGMRGGVAAPSRPAWRKKRGSGTRSEGLSPKPGEGLGQSPPAHSGAGAMQEPLEQQSGPQLRPSSGSSGRQLPELQTPGEASTGVLPSVTSETPHQASLEGVESQRPPLGLRVCGLATHGGRARPPVSTSWRASRAPAALPATGLCLQGE